MAGGLTCKQCDNEINYKANLPRLLICCGYTICHECLTNILKTDKRCPHCRKATKPTDAKDFFVNIALLDIKNNSRDHCRVTYYKTCQEVLIQRKKDFERLTPHLKATINVIDSRIKEINDFQDQMGTITDKEVIKSSLIAFNQSYLDVFHQMSVFPIGIKLVNFRSVCHLTYSEYLKEIKTALTSGQEIVALFNFQSTNFEAPVTLKGDRLCVHSLQKQYRSPSSKTACFRDLQDVLLRDGEAKTIYAFLVIAIKPETPPKIIMIKISKTKSYLGSQFLKFCSGELKHYKGDICTHSEDVDIKYYVQVCKPTWDMAELDNYAKYFLEKANYSATCSPENYYLHMDNNGSFDIFRCKSKSLKRDRIIGQVVDFEGDMEELTGNTVPCRIVDCGIAYDFELK